jgi:FkbM family methyltransferase
VNLSRYFRPTHRRLGWDRSRVLVRDLGGLFKYAGPRTAAHYCWQACRASPNIVRQRSLLPADEAMPGSTYVFRVLPGEQPVTIDTTVDSGDTNIFTGAREMYCRRVYLSQPGFTVHPGDTVIDLGANIGLFTSLAAVSAAKVLAVEAQSGFLPLIANLLDLNGLTHKVTIHLGLVGGGSGLFSTQDFPATHWGTEPPTLAMSALLMENSIETVDFLKIDIEGSEFDLFGLAESGRADLSWLHQIRRIAMEVHPRHGDPAALVSVLQGHGFRAWLTTNSGRPTATVTDPTGFLFATRGL